jgi:hypothetical protein
MHNIMSFHWVAAFHISHSSKPISTFISRVIRAKNETAVQIIFTIFYFLPLNKLCDFILLPAVGTTSPLGTKNI